MEPGYAIIGCGSISRFHFAGLEKLGAKIAHVVDVDSDRARECAKRFDARASADYRDALKDSNVSVVNILTPTRHHLEMCLAAMAAGKDVICEKTLANSQEEACQIAKAAREAGVLFFTAYMKRFFPAVQKAKELIVSLGTLFSACVRTHLGWGDLFQLTEPGRYEAFLDAYGGAILKCAGSHMLDLTLFLLGRPKSLYANMDYVGSSRFDRRSTVMLEYSGPLVVCFEGSSENSVKPGPEWSARAVFGLASKGTPLAFTESPEEPF